MGFSKLAQRHEDGSPMYDVNGKWIPPKVELTEIVKDEDKGERKDAQGAEEGSASLSTTSELRRERGAHGPGLNYHHAQLSLPASEHKHNTCGIQ